MESISVFDLFKIGVGPSSSHTMGPWEAMLHFVKNRIGKQRLKQVKHIHVDLYGSLSKTGVGHGTDIALMMGLLGESPRTTDTALIDERIQEIKGTKTLNLFQEHAIYFDTEEHIIFHQHNLPKHPNALTATAIIDEDTIVKETYYSVGGGFIEWESDLDTEFKQRDHQPEIITEYAIQTAKDILNFCRDIKDCPISYFVLDQERNFRSLKETRQKAWGIWETMKECIYRGCHTDGVLPGGLNVHRRAMHMAQKLMPDGHYSNADEWIEAIKSNSFGHIEIFKWVSCFALAVNEENADFGRVVTAPTNGAAGVIPAVLMYYVCFSEHFDEQRIPEFLYTAGQIGILFKKNATISAAMGGCQAEIGVSSAMAAAGLAECVGASPRQAMVAAEIAMEHHLGLTCDPVGGLVQVPCIERNTMGAIKAIMAAYLAIETKPEHTKVSLDEVIKAMWETAQDMNQKYKETSEGGLAIQVPVAVIEC